MTGYKYASVVRLAMDDPRNDDLNEGDVIIVAGKHDDYEYMVFGDEEFVDVECEVLGVLGADYRMSKSEIKSWAADQDQAAEIAEGSV